MTVFRLFWGGGGYFGQNFFVILFRALTSVISMILSRNLSVLVAFALYPNFALYSPMMVIYRHWKRLLCALPVFLKVAFALYWGTAIYSAILHSITLIAAFQLGVGRKIMSIRKLAPTHRG